MKILNKLLTIILLGLVLFIIVFRIPWYYALWRTTTLLESDSQFFGKLTTLQTFGEAWEERLAFVSAVRPIAEFTSDSQSKQRYDSLLKGVSTVNPVLGVGIASVAELSIRSVGFESTMHDLADLHWVQSSTTKFIDNPSKETLRVLATVYREHLVHLNDANTQFNGLEDSVREVSSISSTLGENMESMLSNPLTANLFSWAIEPILSLLGQLNGAEAKLASVQSEIAACIVTMQDVEVLLDSAEKVEAIFSGTMLEAPLRGDNVRLAIDSPLWLLLGVLVLKVVLSVMRQIGRKRLART